MMLIEDYIKKDNIKWQPLFYKGLFCKEYEQKKELKPLIDFLCEKVSFWYYKDIFSENPFAPLADFTISGGGRSFGFEDLSDADLIKVDECIQNTKHPLFLGFFYDILGIARNNNDNRLLAAKYFTEYSKSLLRKKECNGLTLQPIKRAFALLCLVKNTREIENFIDDFLIHSDFEENDEYPFKVLLIETFYMCSQKTYNKILLQAEVLYKKYVVDVRYIAYSIQLAKIILKIYKSSGDKENIKKWTIAYADCCCNADTSILRINTELETAIEEANALNDFELTNKLRKKKKQLQEDFYKSFHMNTMPFELPKQVEESMAVFRNNIIDTLKPLDGDAQFCLFLAYFNALPKSEIEQQLQQNDRFHITDLVNQIRFNENNEIIFQSATATEKQKRENKIYEIYELRGMVSFNLIINPFIFYIKVNDKCVSLINDIINHNELVYRNHSVVVQNIINGLSEKRIRSALAGILPQFEDGLRNYMEKQGIMPIIRSGGNEVKASLGQMMNTEVFRKHIDDLLGEDLAQHIDYLACKELGGNLRNKYAHEGYGDDSQFSFDEIILFCLLIKAYCMGYDDEIGSK